MSLHGKMMQHRFQTKQITLLTEDIPNNLRSPKHQVSKLSVEMAFQHVTQ